MADFVLPIANLLLDCLNEQFLVPNPNLATPGNFCLIAGEQISEDIDPIIGTDLCCEGLGWVRIADTVPAPNPIEGRPVASRCLPVGWGQVYEVGLLGCYHPGGDPSMATCPEKTAEAVRDAARLEVLKQVACCFNDKLRENPKTRGRDFEIAGIAVSGPRGNCISRVMQITYYGGKCC